LIGDTGLGVAESVVWLVVAGPTLVHARFSSWYTCDGLVLVAEWWLLGEQFLVLEIKSGWEVLHVWLLFGLLCGCGLGPVVASGPVVQICEFLLRLNLDFVLYVLSGFRWGKIVCGDWWVGL